MLVKCGVQNERPALMIIRLTRKWDWHSNSLFLLSPEVRDYAVRVSVFSFFGNSCGERLHSAYLSRLHSCEVLGLWGSTGNMVLLWALNSIPPHSGHPVIQGPPSCDWFLYLCSVAREFHRGSISLSYPQWLLWEMLKWVSKWQNVYVLYLISHCNREAF